MGRHSKKDTPAASTPARPATSSASPGDRFDAQFNASRINGAAAGPQTADDRIAALKKSVSSHRRNKD